MKLLLTQHLNKNLEDQKDLEVSCGKDFYLWSVRFSIGYGRKKLKGKQKFPRPTKMDVPDEKIQTPNVVYWAVTRTLPRPVPQGTIFVSDISLTPDILKHFGTTEKKFQNFVVSQTGKVLFTEFLRLWTQENFTKFDVKFDGKKVEGCRLTGSFGSKNGLTTQYYDGFISKPNLNVLLKRYLHNTTGNEKNPFNSFNGSGNKSFLPDITFLPKLYKRLGIKDLASSGLVVGDYQNAWENVAHLPGLLMTYTFGQNNESIPVLWQGLISIVFGQMPKHITYIDGLPEIVIKRLIVRIENLKNAGGGKAPLATLPRDLLQTITNPEIKGKALIGLCIQNATINRFCNQENQRLFRERLLSEFGVDWSEKTFGFATPRELYVQMHKNYYTVAERSQTTSTGKDLIGYVFSRGGPASHQGENVLYRVVPRPEDKMWKKPYEQIIVFFPDRPDLSFVMFVDQPEFAGAVQVFEDDGPIREILSNEKMKRLAIFAWVGLNQYTQSWSSAGAGPGTPMEWILGAAGLTLAEAADHNILYVFRI